MFPRAVREKTWVLFTSALTCASAQALEASTSVRHPVEGLPIGVKRQPFTPACTTDGGFHSKLRIEGHAVLETHVTLVERLNAGAAARSEPNQG